MARTARAVVPLLCGLCLLAAPAAAKHCEYGSLPGHIVVSTTNTFPLQWEVLDPNCTLSEELNRYFGVHPDGAADTKNGDVAMLMYGDASDGFLAKDICEISAQFGGSPKSGANGESPYCMLPGLQLVSQLIAGVQPQGPYAPGFSEEDAPSKSIPKGLAHFQQLTGKKQPDVVVFSGLLQDVRRMVAHNTQEMAQEFLTKEHVQTWIDQTVAQLQSIEDQHDNRTLLVFHSAVYPALQDCKSGGDHAHPLGKRTHIIQLNKAALHVMQQRPRWHLVDYDQMSMPFSLSGVHLRDGIHAGAPFLAQVANIYLNLYKQHLVESGSKPLPSTGAAAVTSRPASVSAGGLAAGKVPQTFAGGNMLEQMMANSKLVNSAKLG